MARNIVVHDWLFFVNLTINFWRQDKPCIIWHGYSFPMVSSAVFSKMRRHRESPKMVQSRFIVVVMIVIRSINEHVLLGFDRFRKLLRKKRKGLGGNRFLLKTYCRQNQQKPSQKFCYLKFKSVCWKWSNLTACLSGL